MKDRILSLFAIMGIACATGCIEEIDPQTNIVTEEQLQDAPGVFDNMVTTITSNIIGKPIYNSVSNGASAYASGDYATLMMERDVMGQDVAMVTDASDFGYWYSCSFALGPTYAICQIPWTSYYKWIKNCNTVLTMAGEEPDEAHTTGVGIAYTMRAMFYMDLARMFARESYGVNPQAETVPIILENTTITEMQDNPRATNEKIWAFIMDDLNAAETYLAGYSRGGDKTIPDVSVVYGLKARAYLVMQDWPNAEKYAKLAMEGYSLLTEDEYLDRTNGFNTPNQSWMFCITYKPTDACVMYNDGDCSWASWMCQENNDSQMGYATNYGSPKLIDRHLYDMIPASDFRKKCFVDFAIDDMDEDDQLEALKAYTDYPEGVLLAGVYNSTYEKVGGISLKFRLAGGERLEPKKYCLVSIPLMRVEEMKLIEAEAAGMQDEARGKTLLTAFAKTRDANYEYGNHNEAYGNASIATAFQNEIWWQRRVEFWGEGMSTFDIKRYNKGIIRSYAGTNHFATCRWNTESVPDWMNLCIAGTETNYNRACTNNPTPLKPKGDSPEHAW